MTCSVYWIRHPDHTDMFTQGYIGISSNVKQRWESHSKNSSNLHIGRAVKKYGWDNLIKQVVLIADKAYCLAVETKLRPANQIGWNVVGASLLTSGTAVASTSGTSIDFTSIPSWAKRITVMFNGVSTSSSSNLLLQIGNGSVIATGYDSAASTFNVQNTSSTIGFLLTAGNLVTACIVSGSIVLTNFSSNSWVSAGVIANSTTPASIGAANLSGGNKTLSGALDRVRITTVNGTDTFDAGSINILYE